MRTERMSISSLRHKDQNMKHQISVSKVGCSIYNTNKGRIILNCTFQVDNQQIGFMMRLHSWCPRSSQFFLMTYNGTDYIDGISGLNQSAIKEIIKIAGTYDWYAPKELEHYL